MIEMITKDFISKKCCSVASLLNLLLFSHLISFQWIYLLALAERDAGNGCKYSGSFSPLGFILPLSTHLFC